MSETPERIGVAFPGDPSKPSSWSGTPLGVMNGLRESGVEPVPLNVQPPSRLLRTASIHAVALGYLGLDRDITASFGSARQAASLSPLLGYLETITASRQLARSPRLSGLIQIGSSYRLTSDLPIATFEDMTVMQARRAMYPGWKDLPERALERRITNQRETYHRAEACCVMTPWAAQSVVSDYGIDARKVRVVGVGNNHPVSADTDRDWSSPRFLFVGNDWARKNGDAVLRAFGRLRGHHPDAQLDLVGAHPPVDQAGVVCHGVLGLADPCDRDVLTGLFAAATCFVMPSRCDPAGIVYVEAAAAGVASICSDSGGSAFLVGEGGVVVPVDDDGALLAAMAELSNPHVAAAAGARAQRRSQLFTWKAVAERLLRAVRGEPPLLDVSGSRGAIS